MSLSLKKTPFQSESVPVSELDGEVPIYIVQQQVSEASPPPTQQIMPIQPFDRVYSRRPRSASAPLLQQPESLAIGAFG